MYVSFYTFVLCFERKKTYLSGCSTHILPEGDFIYAIKKMHHSGGILNSTLNMTKPHIFLQTMAVTLPL